MPRNPKLNEDLFDAVTKEKIMEVESLLQRGADPDALGIVHEAVYNVDILKLLLDEGANPNMEHTAARYTPLHAAVRCKSDQCVQLLLNAGADPNKQDFKGVTPLYDAGRFEYNKIGRQLIEATLSKNTKENKPSFLSENQELSSAWDSCRDNKRVFKVMNYIESNLDKRLKKPFVSKDYTPEEKKHLIQGLEIALECKEINVENISTIHATMDPAARSHMRFPTRRGGVTINLTKYKSKEGLSETLDWLDKHQAGYGPRFEIVKAGVEKFKKCFDNISELREGYGCKSNLELATKLESELKADNEKTIFRVIPIFDTLNYYVDSKSSLASDTVVYQDIEEDLKKAGFQTFDVVGPKFSQLVDKFNESKKPSIEEIASFTKEMILLHPYVDGNGRTLTLGVLNSALYNNNYGICLDLDPDIVSSTSGELVDDIMKNLVPMSQFTSQEAEASVNTKEFCQMTIPPEYCASLHYPAIQDGENAVDRTATSLNNTTPSLEQEKNKHISDQSIEPKQPSSVTASRGKEKPKDASQFQNSHLGDQAKKDFSTFKKPEEEGTAAAIELLKQGDASRNQFKAAANVAASSSNVMQSGSLLQGLFPYSERGKDESNNKDKEAEKKKLEERRLKY